VKFDEVVTLVSQQYRNMRLEAGTKALPLAMEQPQVIQHQQSNVSLSLNRSRSNAAPSLPGSQLLRHRPRSEACKADGRNEAASQSTGPADEVGADCR
jgi:hypothetical protein